MESTLKPLTTTLILIALLFGGMQVACQSQPITIESDPPGAHVAVSSSSEASPRELGTTPYVLQAADQGDRSQALQITVSKEGLASESVLIPPSMVGRAGSVFVNLDTLKLPAPRSAQELQEPVRARDKLELMTGIYSLEAKTAKKSESLSGAGVYRAAYSHALRSDLEFSLGYTFGDMSYGPDLGVMYFPISETGSRRVVTEKVVLDLYEPYRPFVGIGLHQRQFQSVDSSYVGFSLNGGTEYNWTESFSLKGHLRYQMLQGSSSATANQIDLLFGVTFSL